MSTRTPRKRYIRLIRGTLTLALISLLLVFYTAASIWNYGKQTTEHPAQVAIVLGAAVWNDQPSPVFRERINHAVRLYKMHSVQKVLCTGGQGTKSEVTEAVAAKRYVMLHGVPEKDILVEEQSHTTFENLLGAKQILALHKLQSTLIVSDPLHMKRAMRMAHHIGLNAEPSPTMTSRYRTMKTQFGSLVHETYYYLGEVLRHPVVP